MICINPECQRVIIGEFQKGRKIPYCSQACRNAYYRLVKRLKIINTAINDGQISKLDFTVETLIKSGYTVTIEKPKEQLLIIK